MNAGYLSILILLDFSKAFNTLLHEKLNSKLLKVGFGITATEFLIDYLRNRQVHAVFDSERSSWQFVEAGVPQGSILGTMLPWQTATVGPGKT